VLPAAKLSGSTSAWWLVVADPLQVAWVNGSTPIDVAVAAADAGAAARATTASTALVAAQNRIPRLLTDRRFASMTPPDVPATSGTRLGPARRRYPLSGPPGQVH
jgi:hypothetical protein